MPNNSLKSAAIVLACAWALCSHAVADTPQRLEIPAGDLVSALQTLAKQAEAKRR